VTCRSTSGTRGNANARASRARGFAAFAERTRTNANQCEREVGFALIRTRSHRGALRRRDPLRLHVEQHVKRYIGLGPTSQAHGVEQGKACAAAVSEAKAPLLRSRPPSLNVQ
jgi:hypothetical protein